MGSYELLWSESAKVRGRYKDMVRRPRNSPLHLHTASTLSHFTHPSSTTTTTTPSIAMKLSTASAILAFAVTPALSMPTAFEARGRHSNSHSNTPYGTLVGEPKYFTSAFSTRAVPGAVIANNGTAAPGPSNAFGHFSYKVNSREEIICFDIRTVNVTGEYLSPAFTATHIHQGAAGAAGPPRIAFPNPQYVRNDHTGAEIRESKGCLQGPFSTNVTANGADTGSASGFTLSQIEENPSAFFTDTHTAQFAAGAVRGQLLRSEVPVARPSYFTSTLRTTADGSQVVNAMNASVPGAPNTRAEYVLQINTQEDILCYDITVSGYPEGEEYFSPAKTATHSHVGAFGISGPPRLAFKNPQPRKSNWARKMMEKYGGKKHNNKHRVRKSSACVKGPFTTGVLSADGVDTGSASGFTLAALEANPAGYNADFHTGPTYVAGTVRGQLYA